MKQNRRLLALFALAITLIASSCATQKYGCPGHLNDGPHNYSSRR